MDARTARLNWDQARALLGISVEVTDAELRAAYLAKVQQHPPDRDPEHFELVRDAYEQLRDPRLRARRVLEAADPFAPLADLLVNLPPAQRRFVGVEPWMAVMKEKQA